MPVQDRWDGVEFIELVSILPHGERVEPSPFIAVPQKVASVTSVGEEKRLGRVACEVAVIPPRRKGTTLSLRTHRK